MYAYVEWNRVVHEQGPIADKSTFVRCFAHKGHHQSINISQNKKTDEDPRDQNVSLNCLSFAT